MLDFMRKHAHSWVVSVIIGAIVVVFVLWGIGTFRSAQFQKVAEVDGTNILLPQYLRAYQNLTRTYQERLGADFNEETAKALNLKAQTLNQLIDEVLLQQAAQRLGLMVSDAELRQVIQKYPAFADERGFNEKRYHQLLARQHLTASDFEEQERQRLLLQKVVGFITSFAKVSEADLQETYRLDQEAVRVDFLTIGPSTFLKEQKAPPSEVEAFYDSHKDRFREPEKYQARFTLLKFDNLAATIKPDPQKLEAFFYDHLAEYSQPQKIRVREILLPIPSQASPADRQRLRQQAETILRSVKEGIAFDQLVEHYSQTPGLKIKAEDLGVVSRSQKTPEWEAVAFKLKKGETGLVASPLGFHILQVVDIVENKAPALADVQPQVEKSWRQATAVEMAGKQAAELRAEMLKSSFDTVAKQHQLPVQETPLLTAGESIPGLGMQPAVSRAALSLKTQEISKPISLNDGIVLLQVVDHKPSVVPPLAQIKDLVAEAVRQEKAKAAAAGEAKKVLDRLQKGETLAQVAAPLGLKVKDSGFFTRPQGFPIQPQARNLTTAAFSLTASQPYPDQPISVNGENFLLAFKERRPPSSDQFAQAKAEMEKALLDTKRRILFAQWLAEERRRAKIKVYELPS